MSDFEVKSVRLHLGSGERYLPGYVNIDLPPSEHTVIKVKADKFADFRTLQYAPGSVDEIRCHHVFEHFTRTEAIKLLLTWRKWLGVGGTLHIETPDFDTAVWYYAFSGAKARAEISRHIFGSQEARWANHYDGWGKQKYIQVLSRLGFTAFHFEKRSNSLATRFNSSFFNWIGFLIPNAVYRRFGMNKLPNITVIAKKNEQQINERLAATELLRQYLVGTEGDELLETWLRQIF